MSSDRSARRVSGVLTVFACALLCPSWAFAEVRSPLAERLARMVHPALGEDEQSLQRLRGRLAELPPLSPGHSGLNIGFHSRFQQESDTPVDITIDLGELHSVEHIVVFPVRGMFRGERIDGYGFPPHFIVELSSDARFSEVVASFDSADLETPPHPAYPRQFAMDQPHEARFLRLRVLEHWTRDDGRFLSALGEVMAFSEGRNVALRGTVMAESFTTLPDWYRAHLVDGQTDLGLPVSPEPSPTNGFLSKGGTERFAEKWLQVELPEAVTIDEVVLVPAQPMDAPDQFGHGFPRRFRLRVSADAEFTDSEVVADHVEQHFPNPGDNPVVFAGGGFVGRFVRLEVEELWHISTGRFSLTLAELQVLSGGENRAVGAKVTASDVFDMERFLDVWRPEYLVDGFSSQNRLISLQDWLAGLAEREQVERRIVDLEQGIEARVERTVGWILGGAGTAVMASVGLLGAMWVRRKRAIARHQEALRARIARDLHDDLGSRLGGMRLLSESLLHAEELPSSLQEDLDLLHRSSGEATDAMRDIVWLLDTRERSLEKLRQQMKRLVPTIVGSMPWTFEMEGEPEAEVDFEFRRQVILAFREALNNAVRHSGSDRIECRVGGDAERFWFQVKDWGQGYDAGSITPGNGLANLRKRADLLQGELHISTERGKGTAVRFSAPHRISKPRRLP